MSLLLMALLGCRSEPAPEAATPAPAPAPPPVAAPDDAWTAATIAGLQPVVPARHSRVPVALEPSPALEQALSTLVAVVDARATDPANPWAVGHGLLARGPDLVLSNGVPAVDHLFATYAEELPLDGGALVQFRASAGEVRIEPHTDLLLKSLAGIGVDPGRDVVVAGKVHDVADLWRGSLLRTFLVPTRNHSRYASPDDIAWSLQGLATWAPPDLSWVALDGTPMNLDDLADYTAAVLYSETRFLAEARASGQPFQRKGQGIFRYTCGGAHLLQGVAYTALRGHGSAQVRAVVDEQVGLWFYRYPIEAAITAQALQAFPEHGDKLTVQRLKFAGHFLESMSMLAAMGVYTPDEAQLATLGAAAAEVTAAAAELAARGMLSDLDAVRARDEQLYLDIVGDSAHAVRGLELAVGRAEVAW